MIHYSLEPHPDWPPSHSTKPAKAGDPFTAVFRNDGTVSVVVHRRGWIPRILSKLRRMV